MKKNSKHIIDSIGFVFGSILSDFGIQRNKTILKKLFLRKHPEYPSYNSLFYGFKKFSINCALISSNFDELDSMPTPFIAKLNIENGKFIIVDEVKDGTVKIRTGKKEYLIESIDFFSRFWDGGILLLDYDSKAKLPVNNKKILIENVKRLFPIIFSALVLFFAFNAAQDNIEEYTLLHWSFFVVIISGIAISVLYFIYEIDKSSKLVNQVCHSKSNKNRDCSSILDYKDAYFLDLFKWSDLSSVFFIFFLALILFFPTEISAGWISILFTISVLYVPYSITYQKFISKKWCTLCLLTQLILLVGAILSIINITYNHVELSNLFAINNILPVIILGVFIISAYYVIKTVVMGYIQKRGIENSFGALKISEDTSKAIFMQQKFISTEGLYTIKINPDRDKVVTMIINTYCNPCMNETRKILPLYAVKEDTTLEIIFFLDRTSRQSVDVACLLLNIYKINPEGVLQEIFNYANNYPASFYRYSKNISQLTDDEIKQAEIILLEQEKWCINNGINATPKLFLDYYEKPQSYSYKDIDYFFYIKIRSGAVAENLIKRVGTN